MGCTDAGGRPAFSLSARQSLRFPINADIETLDPALAARSGDLDLDLNLFNGLVRLDDGSLQPLPDIAESLPEVSADGQTLTFVLRRGVRFSNGDPVTSSDFVFSWSRGVALRGSYASMFEPIAGYQATLSSGSAMLSGLDTPDDRTLVVHLSRPAGFLIARLGLPAAAVVDRRVIGTASDPFGRGVRRGKDWASQPSTLIGTGAFRLVGRVPGKELDFEPVAGWWGSPKPSLRQVRLDVVSDATAALAGYSSGQFDLVGYAGDAGLSSGQLVHVSRDLAAETRTTAARTSSWVGFNYERGPFAGGSDAASKLRTAFSLAVDRHSVLDGACGGRGDCIPATGGLVPAGLPGYLGQGTDPLAGLDPARARDLLKAADPDGSLTGRLTYAFEDSDVGRAIARALQDGWQKNLGLQVGLQPIRTGFAERRAGKEFTLFSQGWTARFPDPEELFDGYFIGGATQSVGFDDSQIDSLAGRANARVGNQSLRLYLQVTRRLADDAAYVPLYYQAGTLTVKPYVAGAGGNSLFDHRWSAIQILQH